MRRSRSGPDWFDDVHYGIPPTRAELAHGVGLKDASCVGPHLQALAEGGWIQLLPGKNRGIRVLDQQLPLVRPLAEVAAGTPILCEAHIVERVPAVIANRFRPRPDYLLTVRGDSMDRTGLQDGDIVAVYKTNEARNGQVVVARFGDEVTLKRFWKVDKRHVELRPESHNPEHQVMKLDPAKHILEIDGVAVGALIGEIRDSWSGYAPEENEQLELPEFLKNVSASRERPKINDGTGQGHRWSAQTD